MLLSEVFEEFERERINVDFSKSTFLNWFNEKGYTIVSPINTSPRLFYNKNNNFTLLNADIENIRKTCITTPLESALFELIISGLRISEIANLKRSQIKISESYVVIVSNKLNRKIKINDQCVISLKAYLDNQIHDNDLLIFKNQRKVSLILDRVLSRTKLDNKIKTTDLRRYFKSVK